MTSKYEDFLRGCFSSTNCKIVCKNNVTIRSHKIILAVCGDFIRDLIADVPGGEEVTLYLPDIEAGEVETCVQKILMKDSLVAEYPLISIFGKKSKNVSPESLVQVKLEEENKKILQNRRRSSQDECLDDFIVESDEEESSIENIKEKKSKTKQSTISNKKSEYNPRNVDFEKLRKKLLPNPQSRQDFKHNEIIEKQILHERAIEAYLSGDDSLSTIGQQFGVKKSTLCKLLKCDKKFSGKGNKSHLFTEDEERSVTEKALSWINTGGQMSLNSLRELLTQEINSLKLAQPQRQFGVSARDGAVINKSYVRRFAIRNKLERYMFQKYTLSEKRKFECDICNKSFTLKCSLVTHQKQIHFSFLHTNDNNSY